ncbi:hypothetical protein ZOSMA_202G00010 [Zostera marina]|uniref:MHD1 domain-containing protein n=1 Tax=Zostera marina TaxID=29655 RepID=A0A0K9PNU5_ZOSMR|nr:hypothetical protein ZOSMA_202G00010 [Zostera marina]
MQSAPGSDRDLIEAYISSSIRISFSRVLHYVEAKTDSSHEHVLACLAEETKKLLKTDSTIFMPIFSKWHQLAPVASASLLHKLYGNKLRPFLDHAEHLTEDVVSVFPEADSLERYIMTVISLACEEEIVKDNCLRKLISFEVEKKSGTLVLRWLNAKLGRILEWVERAIQQERFRATSKELESLTNLVRCMGECERYPEG